MKTLLSRNVQNPGTWEVQQKRQVLSGKCAPSVISWWHGDMMSLPLTKLPWDSLLGEQDPWAPVSSNGS